MSRTNNHPKRDSIMDAGLKIFSEKGFHMAKIEEIAHEAGVGKGTVYEYFESKEQLFKIIVTEGIDEFNVKVDKQIKKEKTTRGKLMAIMKQNIQVLQHFRPFARSAMMDVTLFDVPFRTCLMKIHQKRICVLTEIIEEGIRGKEIKNINSSLFAKLFYGGVGMLNNPHEEINLQPEEIENIVEKAVDYYLYGVGASK
ncbi:MAG: TetR/AcrR family transcriptional regulator [Clostridia bacterium]|nr:TetR/AcrR family transcriptional regulator [Clostridia bacterium]MDD4047312.1 TetR/AcrR family transcriptional regulator [Clostridia bacterium]